MIRRLYEPLEAPDLYWLAGWLEGEGTFAGPAENSPRRLRVASGCTDRDIVARAAALMGTVVSPVRIPSNPKHKPSWGVLVTGPRAYLLMIQILPLMGERRSRKIEECLNTYEPKLPPSQSCGTLAGYKRGCRCRPCRERKHREHREYLARQDRV